MMTPIREPEVALHVAGKLSRVRSREVVEASRTDEQVHDWLEKYARLWVKHHRQLEGQSATAPVELDRDLAGRMYRSVEEDEPPTMPLEAVARPYRFTVPEVPVDLGALTTRPSPASHTEGPPELPLRRVNPMTKQLELWELALTIPYGVARVVVEFAGREVFRRLVPFIQEFEGGVEVRKAGLWLSELGVPVADIPKAYFDVIPATDSNLREFPLPEVKEWAKAYSANFAAADAADMLIHRLKREGQS